MTVSARNDSILSWDLYTYPGVSVSDTSSRQATLAATLPIFKRRVVILAMSTVAAMNYAGYSSEEVLNAASGNLES